MTQEEKAKAYDKALVIARSRYSIETEESVRVCLELMFSELKESEDERIRKELIRVFSNREKYVINQSFGDINVSDILAWLEKQANPTEWSKEDEELFSFCCAAIELSNYSSEEHRNYAISFLESLKDRVQPQQKQFTIKFDEESPHTFDEISKNGYVDMNRPIELTIQDEPVFDGMVYEYIKSKEKAGITGKELTAYRQGLEDMWNKLKSK